MNPMMQLMNFMKGMKNPQQAIFQLLEGNTNPAAKQVLELARNGKYDEIEQFARNVCKEKGVDYEEQLSNFRNNIGL